MRYSQKPTYQQQGLLGKGAFAQVYKVRLQGKQYALKRIYNFHLKDPNYYTSIKRQIHIMQKLDHPNIVKLIDIYQTDNSLQMLLEYLPGGNLFQKIKSQDRIPQSAAKTYILDVVKAIKYLHSFPQPILHRDIKPENILLTENNRVKLCDFGSANMIVPDHTRDSYVGTAQYMAPQMKQCKPHDQSLDLWSIGILIYQLLTGNLPNEQQQPEYPDYISRPAEDLIKKILVKEQNKRITIDQIQSHIWFATPNISPEIFKFVVKGLDSQANKTRQSIKQKNKKIKQKYLKKTNFQRQSITDSGPILSNSSSTMLKEAEQCANEYMNQLKKIHNLEQQIKQNEQNILSQAMYNRSLLSLSTCNQQIVRQKLDVLLKKNEQLKKRELRPEVQCKNILNELLTKLDKIKEYASNFPQYYRQRILEFQQNQKSLQPTELPISQYLPKLKIKMLQMRRNSLVELKCIKKRRRQMQMIFVEEPQQHQIIEYGDITTDHILNRHNM